MVTTITCFRCGNDYQGTNPNIPCPSCLADRRRAIDKRAEMEGNLKAGNKQIMRKGMVDYIFSMFSTIAGLISLIVSII